MQNGRVKSFSLLVLLRLEASRSAKTPKIPEREVRSGSERLRRKQKMHKRQERSKSLSVEERGGRRRRRRC